MKKFVDCGPSCAAAQRSWVARCRQAGKRRPHRRGGKRVRPPRPFPANRSARGCRPRRRGARAFAPLARGSLRAFVSVRRTAAHKPRVRCQTNRRGGGCFSMMFVCADKCSATTQRAQQLPHKIQQLIGLESRQGADDLEAEEILDSALVVIEKSRRSHPQETPVCSPDGDQSRLAESSGPRHYACLLLFLFLRSAFLHASGELPNSRRKCWPNREVSR